MEYKLEFFIDDQYKITHEPFDEYDVVTDFQGTLVECNAWLQLNKNGYID